MAGPVTEADLGRLAAAAREASRGAYCPYSGFTVGAAVLDGSGEVVTGANVENASYGLTLCAERVAVFQAVTRGLRDLAALAVYTPTPRPTPPCGACRQVLHEFGPGAVVYCVCDGPETLRTTVADLLPGAFGAGSLGD